MAFRRLFGGEERAEENFIDLTDYSAEITSAPTEGGMYVKIAEITDYNQLRDVTNFVYDRNVLILKVGTISDDEETMKRVTRDLKQLSYDINGDVAGLGGEIIIVTPSGVKVDRRKYEPRSE
ncbi:MAG: cell division protein SepF [Candidatus Thermoplasmatota archaeon]|nr:cell division protein SepF [Candidatus Thermoplasmatota archaeon]